MDIIFIHRQDFKYVSLALRPIVAKINSDYEDSEKFETHLENCRIECRNYKTNVKWFVNYAQKPLS